VIEVKRITAVGALLCRRAALLDHARMRTSRGTCRWAWAPSHSSSLQTAWPVRSTACPRPRRGPWI